MLEALISGGILTAAGGLAFIAYKHPEGYSVIFPVLGSLAAAAAMCALLIAWTDVWSKVSVNVDMNANYPAALEDPDYVLRLLTEIRDRVRLTGIVVMAALVSGLYLTILRLLPWIIQGAPIKVTARIVQRDD